MLLAPVTGMSQPRQILPGNTYLISRRCLRRHYLLRPEFFIDNLFIFLLAVLSVKYGIAVHAFCLLSTHKHLVLTDALGKLPDFLRDFHRLTALATKVLRKWEGSIWDSEQPSIVLLKTPEAIAEKIAYVMANPTAVGAVRYAADWPGLITTPRDLGKGTWTAKRPSLFFDQESKQWPDQATLTLTMPPMVEEAFSDPIAVIKQEYEELQHKARREMAEKGRAFLGPARVMKISPYQRATSWEEIRALNPTFAVDRGRHEARKLAIAALKAFRQAYRAALDLWRAGDRTVVFPQGTWAMAVFHGAPVADSG